MKATGTVLLELMVALLVMAVAASGVLGELRQALATQSRLKAAEGRMARASGLLGEYALLPGDALAQRLGSQRHGGLVVTVTRPEQGLYRVAVKDTLGGAAEELVTVLSPELP